MALIGKNSALGAVKGFEDEEDSQIKQMDIA